MFNETRAAWRRLTLAWGDLRVSRSRRWSTINETTMTPEQMKHFDAALEHMDRAFDEVHKALK